MAFNGQESRPQTIERDVTAASHLLKFMALDLQGFRSNALYALDTALSPLAATSLAARRGTTLCSSAPSSRSR
ncbi:hypothetical protein Fmac_003721 [Flemingia macrophylla]|uniref:Uncharacterized protein n=1 Tax=Flemingia macrophylla TaxID=520843 RepID=A0ABD1N3H5_9FABA